MELRIQLSRIYVLRILMNKIQSKWDRIHAENGSIEVPPPAYVLAEFSYLLPGSGKALEIACGQGGNACYLASRGLKTLAWDISPVAIAKLDNIKNDWSPNLNAEIRDVTRVSFPRDCFDIIVVSRFLDRTVSASIVSALKPGGLLYYQTFVVGKDPKIGPSNRDYLLTENELLSMFSALTPRVFYDVSRVGDLSKGLRNEACYIGQKPLT